MKADEVLCWSGRRRHVVPLCCNTRGLLWPWGNQHRRNTIQSELLSVPNAKHVFGGCTVIHSARRKRTIYINYAVKLTGDHSIGGMLQFKHVVWLLALLQKGKYELNITAGSKAFISRGKIWIDWATDFVPSVLLDAFFFFSFFAKSRTKVIIKHN